jgi:hypothetical protein
MYWEMASSVEMYWEFVSSVEIYREMVSSVEIGEFKSYIPSGLNEITLTRAP